VVMVLRSFSGYGYYMIWHKKAISYNTDI